MLLGPLSLAFGSLADVRIPRGAIELPAAYGEHVWGLMKGRPTKYIKRVPKPGGGFRYYYQAGHGGGVHAHEHMVEGARFRHGDGHFQIHKVDGDKLHVRHTGTGAEHVTTKRELAGKLEAEHAEGLKAYRERAVKALAEAKANKASPKQVAKLEERVKRAGGGEAPKAEPEHRPASPEAAYKHLQAVKAQHLAALDKRNAITGDTSRLRGLRGSNYSKVAREIGDEVTKRRAPLDAEVSRLAGELDEARKALASAKAGASAAAENPSAVNQATDWAKIGRDAAAHTKAVQDARAEWHRDNPHGIMPIAIQSLTYRHPDSRAWKQQDHGSDHLKQMESKDAEQKQRYSEGADRYAAERVAPKASADSSIGTSEPAKAPPTPKGKVRVALANGEWSEPKTAATSGVWASVPGPKNRSGKSETYTLTHIPTGISVGSYVKPSATAILSELGASIGEHGKNLGLGEHGKLDKDLIGSAIKRGLESRGKRR